MFFKYLSRVFVFILYHMVLLLCFITKYVIQEVKKQLQKITHIVLINILYNKEHYCGIT